MDKLIPFLADGLVFIIVAISSFFLIVKVPNNRKYLTYGRILVAGLTSYLIAKIMSIVYQPSSMRPFELMNVNPGASYMDNPGFPSDHSLFVSSIRCFKSWRTLASKLTLSCLLSDAIIRL